MKKYFKKLSKKVNSLFLVMVMLFNTFAPYVVKADELSVGKLRLPGSTDYRDEVEVVESLPPYKTSIGLIAATLLSK